MTRRLFVSDVHLMPEDTSDDQVRLRAFSALLSAAIPGAIDEIYVLGDLCEMWIGDDDQSALVGELATLFATLSKRLRIFFMPGNRDFLLGQAFAARTGLELLQDPHQLPDGCLLSHGDSLCTDDKQYQQMRALLRSPEWQQDILSKSLAERAAFGAGLRAQSKIANENKASNIMDVNSAAVAKLVTLKEANLFIHGHTHRPAVHPSASTASKDAGLHRMPKHTRVVLGAWERCAWWAVQESPGKTSLRCAAVSWLAARSAYEISAAAALD